MTQTLQAQLRETKTRGDVKALRKTFKLPGVVYGHGLASKSVSFDYNEFVKVFAAAGMSSLVNVTFDGAGATTSVVISDVQKDPITDRFTHVDLYAVRMDEKIKTEVTINFVGESPAVKSLGGNLIIAKDNVHIECLPKDLISSIEVDISKLTELDQSIHVSDLSVPKEVTVLDDPLTSIVSVLAPKAEVIETEAPADVLPEGAAEPKEGEVAASAEGDQEKKENKS